MNIVSAERLREVLSYDPESGEFRWLVASSRKTRVGSVAGYDRPDGYRGIGIDGFPYMAHRLAFLYMTGKFPEVYADHIDLNRSNNRWSNLREATSSENKINVLPCSRNKSGYKGVSWHRGTKKWQARITVNGQHIHLGLFASAAKADEAYSVASLKYFGKFARVA